MAEAKVEVHRRYRERRKEAGLCGRPGCPRRVNRRVSFYCKGCKRKHRAYMEKKRGD